jgi:flavin-dependent dehydrogenase
MEKCTDVLIVGGGLAGLASGIHLAQKGVSVTLIEKETYPKHKVCGEYISNEILPYLNWLGVDISSLNPVKIDRFEFSSEAGTCVKAQLPLGGVGVSRYQLDNYLYEHAVKNGCTVVKDNVTTVSFSNDAFVVTTPSENYNAKIVLGAYGKRSGIDVALSRTFIQKKSPWLAVKAHYKGNFPDDVVALHNFPGGYCGVSKVENDVINICYLADYETFKQYKNIEEYQRAVLYKNPLLREIISNSTLLFEKPLAISQISFEAKESVENHILMMGDTAGLIHPLCGNGMAMAIHSAKIASELAIDFLNGSFSRQELEDKYRAAWRHNFNKRLVMGRALAKALKNPALTKQLLKVIVLFPSILPALIRQTHGKPIKIDAYGN